MLGFHWIILFLLMLLHIGFFYRISKQSLLISANFELLFGVLRFFVGSEFWTGLLLASDFQGGLKDREKIWSSELVLLFLSSVFSTLNYVFFSLLCFLLELPTYFVRLFLGQQFQPLWLLAEIVKSSSLSSFLMKSISSKALFPVLTLAFLQLLSSVFLLWVQCFFIRVTTV
jgi:hypothetical protein